MSARPLLPLQPPVLITDTNLVDTVITGMAAAALLRMHGKGIRHHFHSNPTIVVPITAVLQHVSLSFLQIFPIYHSITVVPINVQISASAAN